MVKVRIMKYLYVYCCIILFNKLLVRGRHSECSTSNNNVVHVRVLYK